MVIPISASATFSVVEISDAISLLSEADWLRLGKISKRFSFGRIDPDDLLQEAFASVLEGRRKCPHDIDIVRFLAGAMRSLASSQFKSLSHSPELHFISTLTDDENPGIDLPTETPNAAQTLISEQEVAAIHSAIMLLFSDDEIAKLIIEGDMEGMDASELYELTGLDKIAYASKRRLIRRRIDKAYPEGWTP